MTLSIYFFILLVLVLSMDAFAAGFSYGLEKVRVPFLSLSIIALLSGSMLTASMLLGNLVLDMIPERFTRGLSFFILFLLSLYKFYDALPWLHRKSAHLTTEKISQKVNRQDKDLLSCREAALLAFALSVDNISAGLCTGTVSLPPALLWLLTTAIHFLTLKTGLTAGKIMSDRSGGLAWLGAAILLVLAFLRLI